MKVRQSVADQILEIVSQSPDCRLDEVVHACPDFTWNQIFLEIDRLSRGGDLLLKLEAPGIYTVRLPLAPPSQRHPSQTLAAAS